MNSTVADKPKAFAMDSASSVVYFFNLVAFSSENTRTVAPKEADSGITFVVAVSPAFNQPMLTITGSNALKRLVTMVCNADIISVSTLIGSFDSHGIEPWPPLPATVTKRSPAEAMSGPALEPIMPSGYELNTCSP